VPRCDEHGRTGLTAGQRKGAFEVRPTFRPFSEESCLRIPIFQRLGPICLHVRR
jgi:hypothetical protein